MSKLVEVFTEVVDMNMKFEYVEFVLKNDHCTYSVLRPKVAVLVDFLCSPKVFKSGNQLPNHFPTPSGASFSPRPKRKL